jgi:hypothetical protein
MGMTKTKRGHYQIEVFTHHYPGYGEDAPPSDEIKIICDNRLLALEYNLGEVGEYLLIQRWKKKVKKPGFAKTLRRKKRAFSLCHFCKQPIKKEGGSVWDIHFCSACDKKGLVDQYCDQKKAEQEGQQKQDEARRLAEEDRRKRELVLRCESIRSGTLLGSNDSGEFWLVESEEGQTRIFFIKNDVEWDCDIQEAVLERMP